MRQDTCTIVLEYGCGSPDCVVKHIDRVREVPLVVTQDTDAMAEEIALWSEREGHAVAMLKNVYVIPTVEKLDAGLALTLYCESLLMVQTTFNKRVQS